MIEQQPKAEPTIVAVPNPLKIKVLLAHPSNYSKVRREPEGIVIHATHGAEGPNKDFDEAYALAKPQLKRSFHYVVDSNSATRCVPDLLTAWHCRATGNSRFIGVELCGRADQTREQWFDKVSLATLNIAVRLCVDICREHKIPPVLVDMLGLKKRSRGITTHAMVSSAFKESDHWDPGPHFPLTEFIEAVKQALEAR